MLLYCKSQKKAKYIEADSKNNYEEILLIGSGKGVASVKNIKQLGWKRKKLDQYKIFSKYYNSAISRTGLYTTVSTARTLKRALMIVTTRLACGREGHGP